MSLCCPTHASWLNQIEIWFSILSRQALQGANFTSVAQLRHAIDEFIKNYNSDAAPFEWTKSSTIYHVSMPFYMRLSGEPFGTHAGYLPGYPASHGCIRMPKNKAALFFKNVIGGTLVLIVPELIQGKESSFY